MAKKILIVDDEVDTLNLLATTLAVAGYETAKASSGSAGISLISEFKPDAIILDVMMPEQSGIEVMSTIKKMFPEPPPVIIFSARGRIEDMVDGMEAGAYKYLVKPVSREKLLETIRSALASRLQAGAAKKR
jgi:two-component system OmpR family response regulator